MPLKSCPRSEEWLLTYNREKLREQHVLSTDIATAITQGPLGETIDESELDDELAELEQEQLDTKMLGTGAVPVSDQIHRLPAAAHGERKLLPCMLLKPYPILTAYSQRQGTRTPRGRGRRGRTTEIASRDGDVIVRSRTPRFCPDNTSDSRLNLISPFFTDI